VKYGFFPGCAYHAAAGYKESVDAVNKIMGLEFDEIRDWNCCGATTFFGLDKLNALALNGRLFALAQHQGFQEIVTVCNACFTTLRKANEAFEAHPELRGQVNDRLTETNLRIDGPVRVRHYLDVLVNDIPRDLWLEKRKNGILELSVAAYYGCQLNRPWKDMGDSEHPSTLENFLQTLGFSTIEHSAKTACCGASHTVAYAKNCRPLIARIIDEMRSKGADVATTVCPLCQFNLDAGQHGLKGPAVPVPYFSQLVGLALGLSKRELGLHKLLIPMPTP
jgi:heterodisulfide reductase subunit B